MSSTSTSTTTTQSVRGRTTRRSSVGVFLSMTSIMVMILTVFLGYLGMIQIIPSSSSSSSSSLMVTTATMLDVTTSTMTTENTFPSLVQEGEEKAMDTNVEYGNDLTDDGHSNTLVTKRSKRLSFDHPITKTLVEASWMSLLLPNDRIDNNTNHKKNRKNANDVCRAFFGMTVMSSFRGGSTSHVTKVDDPLESSSSTGTGTDENYVYEWKQNSKIMYDHAVAAIPWMFRDKSRRKILTGIATTYLTKTGLSSSSSRSVSETVVVTVDEGMLYKVIRDVTPSMFLSKSISILDQYSSSSNNSGKNH